LPLSCYVWVLLHLPRTYLINLVPRSERRNIFTIIWTFLENYIFRLFSCKSLSPSIFLGLILLTFTLVCWNRFYFSNVHSKIFKLCSNISMIMVTYNQCCWNSHPIYRMVPKLLSGFQWPTNRNPDNNLESPCTTFLVVFCLAMFGLESSSTSFATLKFLPPH
jgi:hypothetical protein